MYSGFNGLAAKVQTAQDEDPFNGKLPRDRHLCTELACYCDAIVHPSADPPS